MLDAPGAQQVPAGTRASGRARSLSPHRVFV